MKSKEGKEHSSHNKMKEGQLDWVHIAYKLPPESYN
jgi:hypothetical protein